MGLTSPPGTRLTRKLGNHNRSWIWGRHVVLETLRVGAWTPLVVQVSPRCAHDVAAEVRARCQQQQIECHAETDAALSKTCRAEDHQGLAAHMPEFPYADFDPLLINTATRPSWLVLDGIQDSFNFGAMVRTAVELGLQALMIGTVEQSGVNSQVARSSAGGVNHVPIVQVATLAEGVRRLKDCQVQLVAASEKAQRLVQDVDLTLPTAIVIGNEGRGISEAVWSQCDTHVRIPTTGKLGSLNAAVAAAIMGYELVRQRRSTV